MGLWGTWTPPILLVYFGIWKQVFKEFIFWTTSPPIDFVFERIFHMNWLFFGAVLRFQTAFLIFVEYYKNYVDALKHYINYDKSPTILWELKHDDSKYLENLCLTKESRTSKYRNYRTSSNFKNVKYLKTYMKIIYYFKKKLYLW